VAGPTPDLQTIADDDPEASSGMEVGWSPQLVPAFTADGERPPERRTLDVGGVRLGRGADFFPGGPLEDGKMSCAHLCIERRQGRWVASDLGSRNGVRLNGERLHDPSPMSDGDVLRLGDTLLVFVANPADVQEDDPHLIGSSAAAPALRRTLERVAGTDATVLLSSETGTGKEVL